MFEVKDNKARLIEIGNTKIEHELRRGLLSSLNWSTGTDVFPSKELNVRMHKAHQNDKATMFIEYDAEALSIQEHDIDKLVADCVAKMRLLGDRASDLYDVIKYLWMVGANSPNESKIIKVDEILTILGFNKQKAGGHKIRHKQAIARLMDLLRLIHLKVSVVIYEYDENNRKKSRRRTIKSPAIIVDSCVEDVEEEDGKTSEVDYQWEVRPGKVLSPFLDAPNKRWAFMDRKILELSPSADKYAKRIGKSGTWYFKLNFKSRCGKTILKVSSLLRDSMIEVNARSPGKTAEAFEAAREKLVKEGIFKTFEYEDLSILETLATRAKGWKQAWLDSLVVLEPPGEIVDIYETPTTKKTEKTGADSPQDAVSMLNEFIQSNGMTQPEAAALIGCSQPHLSMILKRRRKMSKRLEQKVHAKCVRTELH